MKLVLIRHGQSEWNKKNLFTGWEDVELSEQGIEEAKHAGQLIKNENISFDHAFTSVLKRAVHTLNFVLKESNQDWLPITKHWRLNERHYGALQGLNKAETAAKYGDEKVHQWRRSYDVLPPLMEVSDEHHPTHERRYANVDQRMLPSGENLKVTLERVLPYWSDAISPALLRGDNVVIAAHGNSLRALIKYLDNISDADIMEVEIPTGTPLVYELADNLTVVSKKYLK